MQFRNNNFEKILASFTLALINSAAAGHLEYPGDLCCTLYRNSNYEGDQLNLCFDEDTYGHEKQQQWILRDYHFKNSSDNWENRLSSYWCGKNVSYDFCDKYYGDCDGDQALSGAGNVMNPKFGHNDKTDRVRMRYYDAAERGAATLFRDDHCQHDTGRFYADPDPTQTAKYTKGQMEAHNMKNDKASSIMIPYGYSVKLWTDNGFSGHSVVIHGEEWTDLHEQMQCISLKDYNFRKDGKNHNFQDRVSSLEVFRTEKGRKAQGYWKSISKSAGEIYHYKEQTIYADSNPSDADKEAYNHALIMEMNSGIDFVGSGGLEATITDEYANEIIEGVKLRINKETQSRYSRCDGGQPGQASALWQFVVSDSQDDMWVETEHTVCRYGADYNVTPECPFNACDGDWDSNCSVCSDDWKM